jgi:uncharacterized iron-regulated membrane protein
MQKNKRQKQAKVLRIVRKIHRTMGVFLFVFFFIIAVTGILLGWKGHTKNLILPQTATGTTSNLSFWLPLDSLHKKAIYTLRQNVSSDVSIELDRIDIRKNMGVAKFLFEESNWEIQIDGATGEVLSFGKRYSDLIEDIHDGTILDSYLKTSNKQIMVIYTSLTGLALLTFTITGFWLWYGPKRIKKSRESEN